MNAIFSCYFTGKPDPQRKAFIKNNDIHYMKVWADSVRALGLDGFVFHDHLSDEFVAEYTTRQLTFVRVDSVYPYTTNDYRFLTYLDFIQRHAFDYVVMTDISDVRVVCDPFPLMEKDKLYVGADRRRLVQYLYSHKLGEGYRVFFDSFGGMRLLNAGVVGGHITQVRQLLCGMADEFREIGRPKRNLNMTVLNYVAYRGFDGRIVHGSPVTSEFKKYQNDRTDVWFIHK